MGKHGAALPRSAANSTSANLIARSSGPVTRACSSLFQQPSSGWSDYMTVHRSRARLLSSQSIRPHLRTLQPSAGMGSQQNESEAPSGPPRYRFLPRRTGPLAPVPMPANWNLWKPNDAIVFRAAAAASVASASVTTTSRTFVQQTGTSIVSQHTTAYRIHTTALAQSVREDGYGNVDIVEGRRAHSPAEQTVADAESSTSGSRQGVARPAPTAGATGGKDEEQKKKGQTEVLPPATDLAYKMSDDLFRAARDAPAGTPESFWSYTLYRRVEDGARVKVHYCKSKHTTERVCREYFSNEPLLGFDLEWMADAAKWHGARRNVCLVQLASPSRIGLFHLSLYPSTGKADSKDDLVAPTLRRILEDPRALKTGVFIKGDATRLRNFLGIEARGTFELSHLHRLVKYSRTGEWRQINKKLVSLAAQVEEHLRLPMFKGQDVRSSNWAKPLTMDQIIYSASDAYAAVQIFSVLEKQRLQLKPTPPRPAFSELGVPIKLADGVTTIPTAAEEAVEEAVEEPEQDANDQEVGGSPAKLSPEFLAAARESIYEEADGDGDGDGDRRASGNTSAKAAGTPLNKPATPAKKSPSPRPSPKPPATPAKPKDARIVAAEEWLARYRTSGGQAIRAKPASLRAYYLWHGQDDLDPPALAALLRDPPLQTNTVVNYILDAVQLEKLPYHKARLRLELLEQLPPNVVKMRFSGLARSCGYSDPSSSSNNTGSTSNNSGSSR